MWKYNKEYNLNTESCVTYLFELWVLHLTPGTVSAITARTTVSAPGPGP